MPLHSETLAPKLPTFKQWKTSKIALGTEHVHAYQVFGIYLPNKYPDITFVTEEFRYSFRCSEPFLKLIHETIGTLGSPLLVFYDSSCDSVEVYEYEDYVSSGRKFKPIDGTWESTHVGYLWTITPVSKKPRK